MTRSIFATSTVALLLLVGCGDDKVQTVQPDLYVWAPHATAEKQPLVHFEGTPVLKGRPEVIRIENRGAAPLEIKSLDLATAEDAFFYEGDAPPFTLVGGASKELVVVFKPPAQQEFEGSLTVVHNDGKKPPAEVALRGEGTTVGRIEIEPEPLVVDFGEVGEGTQVERVIDIASVGTGPLILEDVFFVEGETAKEFSFVGSVSTPAELPPDAEVGLTVACGITTATEGTEVTGKVRILSTDPDQRELDVVLHATVNRAPIAVAEADGGVPAPGDPIALDGTQSHDPDGDEPLTYEWVVSDGPAGANATFDDPTSPTPSFVTDVPGPYRIGLNVVDAAGVSCLHPEGNPSRPCDFVDLQVLPADDVVIEVVWDHPLTDLDVHLIEQGSELCSSQDCYYGNPTPDFGEFGNALDDPRLVRDDLGGFGPERILLSKPSEGKYDVAVVFSKNNGAIEQVTQATVRVYVFGILEAEMTRTLDGVQVVPKDPEDPESKEDLLRPAWRALTIDWPDAILTSIDTVEMLSKNEGPCP